MSKKTVTIYWPQKPTQEIKCNMAQMPQPGWLMLYVDDPNPNRGTRTRWINVVGALEIEQKDA